MAEDDLSEEKPTLLPESFAYVIEQIQNGQDDMAIERRLAVNTGMSRGDAFEVVKEVHAYLAAVTAAGRLTFVSLFLALAGGAAAAILGSVFWWQVSGDSDDIWDIAFLSLFLGGVTGFTVSWMSQRKTAVVYRGIAPLSTVFGIVIGKYWVYVQFLKEAIREQSGEAAASTVSWFSHDIIDSFVSDFTSMFSGQDYLWGALAVFAAWWMSRGKRSPLPKREA